MPCLPAPRPGCTWDVRTPGHPNCIEDHPELWTVTAPTCGDDDRQGFAALIARQMGLGGPTATRTSQGVIGRFGLDATRSSTCPSPSRRAPAACWWARAMVESTLTSHTIWSASGEQPGQHRRPHPGILPPPKQPVHRLPRPVPGRDVPPRRSGADPPPDPIDELVFRPLRRSARLLTPRQQRLQQRPLHVGQIRPPRYSSTLGTRPPVFKVSLGRTTFFRRPRSFRCQDTPD